MVYAPIIPAGSLLLGFRYSATWRISQVFSFPIFCFYYVYFIIIIALSGSITYVNSPYPPSSPTLEVEDFWRIRLKFGKLRHSQNQSFTYMSIQTYMFLYLYLFSESILFTSISFKDCSVKKSMKTIAIYFFGRLQVQIEQDLSSDYISGIHLIKKSVEQFIRSVVA